MEILSMRRKDRAIMDLPSIIHVIDKCEIIRLGFADGDFPYIVPLNFGYTASEDQIEFYVHGAMVGRKYELMKKNGKCSFEMDNPLQMECLYEDGDVTQRFESVMGTADITLLEGEDRQKAIDEVIMARHEETKNFPYNKSSVGHTAVAKLTVREISCKINPLKGGAD